MATKSGPNYGWQATAVLLCAFALVFAGSSRAATVYYVDQPMNGTGAATGSITTNGTIGQLQIGDILDWNLHLNAQGYTSTLTPSNSQVQYWSSTGLSATATDLTFDFSYGHQLYFYGNGSEGELCYDGGSHCQGSPSISLYHVGGVGNDYVLKSGVQVIATAASTPEPSSLALLGLGGGMLGFKRTRWLRRRRA